MSRLALMLLCLASASRGQMTASGDMTITGQTGMGTAVPQATLEIKLSSADAYTLRVSSPNGAPLLLIDKAGQMGIGLVPSGALLDVNGRGDASDIGLHLRSGNSSSTVSSSQIVFAYDSSGTYRHSLRTRAAGGQNIGNAVEFYLWRSTGQPSTLGSMNVASLQASQSVSSASVHILPAGDPVYELVVSNGQTTGAGKVMAAAITTHSRRELKSDIAYFSDAEEKQAYDETKDLRHAQFRYKRIGPRGWEADPGAPMARGLIYEDAPDSIRSGVGKSLVVENRLSNLEMALKSANEYIAWLETKISELEARK
ncbi:MAG: hypothetical protein AAB036_07070 [Elusimicrobiota bacterium]